MAIFTADTMIDEDTKLGDLLPFELIGLFNKPVKPVKKYTQTVQDKIEFLTDLIESYEVMGDKEMAELKRKELKKLIK